MTREIYQNIPAVYARSPQAWSNWLEKHAAQQESVWLIIYRKESGVPSLTYSQAVEEALCFGWIDSRPNKRDEESYYQLFARRNPKSKWSRLNKQRVEKLIREGRMRAEGMAVIELAKQNGSWNALDAVEDGILPEDLHAALKENGAAFRNFMAFPAGVRRGILEWISSAKKPETRQKRISETAMLAARNERANQWRK